MEPVPDDPVVQEFDVELAACEHNVYALRYPLKGPLADVTGVTSARMRFNFKTLQVTHKIDQSDGHYNSSAVAACQLKQITHESSVSPGHVGFAVGKIKDGKLVLLPVSTVLQMRPTFTHLHQKATEPEAAAGPAESSVAEEAKDSGLERVHAQFLRKDKKSTVSRPPSYASHLLAVSEDDLTTLSVVDPYDLLPPPFT